MCWNFLKRLVLFASLLGLFLMVFVYTAIAKDSDQYVCTKTITCQLEAGKYEIQNFEDGAYQSIIMRQFSMMSDYGKPMLPYTIKEILLSKAIDRSSVRLEVHPFQTMALPGTYNIKPAPRPKIPEGEHVVLKMYSDVDAYFDNTVYLQDRFFPENMISMMPLTMGSSQGELFNIVRLVFSPFQYNPVTGKLRLAKDVTVTVHYKLWGSDEAESKLDTNATITKYDYVIITTEQVEAESAELANFVKHKELLGFSVKIVTEEDFEKLDGPAPNRRAEKIRQWLINNWESMEIEYVLLIGNPDPDDPMYSQDVGDEKGDLTYSDDDYIPMKQVWHGLPGRSFASPDHDPYFLDNAPMVHWGDATDWYYADLTGNWDADGDGFYGECPWVPQSDIETSPLPLGISKSAFSVRWTKTYHALIDGESTFYVKHWRGFRLIIDGNTIVNNWPTAKIGQRQNRNPTRKTSQLSFCMVPIQSL